MEGNDNYSHILIIKVWDTISETTSDYGNIESIVKQRFLEDTFKFKSIEMKWKKIVLSPLNKAFGLGDIVIDSPFESDETLLQSLTSMIKYIDKELHQIGKLNKNNKIIFKLIKPLVEKKYEVFPYEL
jgi:hypothetical protein